MAEVPLPTPTDNAVPSTDIRDAVYAGAMLDKVVTSTELTYTDRLGGEHYTVDGVRQYLIPLSRQYMTLSEAQADIANIPNGSATYVRSADGSSLADEYINNAGVLEATGRKMPSMDAVDTALSDANLSISMGMKTAALMTYSGELFNGSTGWNGAEVVSGARYGGWKTPAGQTGFNTYVFAQLVLSASELATLSGKSVSFVIDITHSSNLSGKLSDTSLFIPMLRINGTDIADANITIISVSDTNSIAVFERQITSSDSSVMLALRYRNSSPLSSDVTFYNRAAYYRMRDAGGFVVEQNNFDKFKFIPPVNNFAYLSAKSAEALGGASLNSVTATISIPSGQNGYNSYLGAFQRVHNNRARAGETIRLVAKYSCSSGFLRTLTASQIGMLAQRNGVQSSSVQIAGTEKLVSLTETSFMVMADYVVAGSASELVSIYFQVKDNTFAGSARTFTLSSAEFFFI
ncbi:hypothetical protein VXT04_22535, partial [Klebsiella pneumoniae]|nr:hypothetical protein [Klebsiella pneumoniae]